MDVYRIGPYRFKKCIGSLLEGSLQFHPKVASLQGNTKCETQNTAVLPHSQRTL